MKFTDGAWRTAEGFDIHQAKEVRFVKTDGDKVTLTMPSFHIYNRGMTLSGPYITMEITSPFENVSISGHITSRATIHLHRLTSGLRIQELISVSKKTRSRLP